MPKKPVDYSQTFAYMLCCKDPTITDVYVGHTTNLTKRKSGHKNKCNNPTDKSYNVYVYQFIRENGGWNNWEMIVLETKSCIDGDDARRLERKWFEEKKASLNTVRPFVSKEEMIVDKHVYYQERTDEILEKRKIYRASENKSL
jgi:hypothetical protein